MHSLQISNLADATAFPSNPTETTMFRPTRRAVAALIAGAVFVPGAAFAADAPKQIAIDWATYNPVSIILKEEGPARKGIREGRYQDRLGAIGRLQQGA